MKRVVHDVIMYSANILVLLPSKLVELFNIYRLSIFS